MAKLCADCGKPQFETPSGIVCENGHGGAASIETEAEYVDGQRLDLGSGWYLMLDASTREGGELQGFVFRPDGRDSASLEAARLLGHLTGGYETKLPSTVHTELLKGRYDTFE